MGEDLNTQKPPWDITSHPLRWVLSQKQKITSVGEDVEKLELPFTVSGIVKWHNQNRKHITILQKIKNRTTIWSINPTCRYIFKRIESRISKRYLYTHVHSSTIHNSQEVEATQIPIDGWIDKQSMVYTYNGILFSLKKEENPVSCYMDKPWYIMLSEIKPSPKVKYHKIPLI